MGGSGSTRWRFHNRKTQVEECHKLTIFFLKPYMRVGYSGSVRWSRGQRETGSISYKVWGGESPEKIRLLYTKTDGYSGEKTECDYFVRLQTTPLPWGGVRYWFTCPLVVDNIPCNRRVGALYLPPRQIYFGCRHCYDLTYKSAQERGLFDGMFKNLAAMMQGTHPGITGKDVEYLLLRETGKAPPGFYRRMAGRYLDDYIPPEPYKGYLTADELRRESGLSAQALLSLESARLLLPDTKDGRYRPKLAGWSRKLAYLLSEGWNLDEIRRWAKGRWRKENPRGWPPKRDDWREEMET